jgi:hypothetical protein
MCEHGDGKQQIPQGTWCAAGVSWDGSGVCLAVATDHILYLVNIRPNYQYAACGSTLAYTFQSRTTFEHFVMFWNTTTNEQHCKASKPVLVLAGHGLYALVVTKGAYWGKYSLTICNSIGSPVDSRTLHLEPSMAAITSTHAVVCSSDLVYVWNFCTPQVWLHYVKVPGRQLQPMLPEHPLPQGSAVDGPGGPALLSLMS